MGGLPCIRGLRIPVATVVGMVGEGMAEAAILDAYPDLEVEDVREASALRGSGTSRSNFSMGRLTVHASTPKAALNIERVTPITDEKTILGEANGSSAANSRAPGIVRSEPG